MPPLACAACGTPTVPGARFCFHCGQPVDVTEDSAERRVVTVLFGDLSDFTAWAEDLDPERVKVVTDTVLTALAQAVQAYGGHVDKLTGDGIMAVFGAPTAHEDDAERAVRAAVAMQSAVRRLVADETGGGRRLGLRVGLNTGEVLAGMQAALAYTVVGDTVNTASRLSDAAGVGAVLAGRDTALATMPVASWRALSPLRLKGKREPVAAYELVALRSRTSARLGIGDEAPLIGREAELGLLIGRLMDVVDTRAPAAVVVTGDAGVGKTRLARELRRFAGELPHSRVLWGRCTPYGEGGDLAPVVDMVRTACGIEDGDDDATVRDRVRRTVARLDHPASGAWGQGLFADRLLAVLGLGDAETIALPTGATPGTGDGNDEAEAVIGLFRSLARQGPLLLVVDDVHWSGEPLRAFLRDALLDVDGPLLVVLAGRTADGFANATTLPVEPLEEAAAERLLRAYLGGAALDDASRDLLLDRAEGNPFFLAELLHLLVDRGLLVRDPGAGWLAGELPSSVLPAGVQAVLAARIDGLDPAAKDTLRDAAVVGAEVHPDLLAAMAGTDVTARLAELAERDILRARADGTYVFAHTLTREVAYAGVPKAGRAKRHARVAVWAAAALPGSPAEVDAFVAQHAERAADLAAEMAIERDETAAAVGFAALQRLGRSALAHDDNLVAADLLARALRLGEDRDTRVAYAQALAGGHRLAEAERELADALAEGDPEALAVLGDIRRKQEDEPAAVTAFTDALVAATAAGEDRLAGEVTRQLGLIDYFAGRLRQAEDCFWQALELAERVGDQRGAGWALQHIAWSATTRGDYLLADQMLARATAVFASFGDTGGVAWSLGTEAFVRLLEGRLADSRAITQAVLPQSREGGDRWGTAACLTIDSMAASELGLVSLAVREAEESAALFADLGDTWGRTLALIARGLAARAGGDGVQAALCLRDAVALAESARQPSTATLALLALGWTLWYDRDLDGATAAATEALRLAREVGLEPHAQVGCHVLLALVDRARGRLDEALAVLGEIAASPERPTLLFPMRQALAHYAGTLLDSHRAAEALAAAERAVATPAEDVRSRVIALRALGSALAANGRRTDAEETLRQALAIANGTEQAQERAATERALAEVLV